jgi:hypothetical protein
MVKSVQNVITTKERKHGLRKRDITEKESDIMEKETKRQDRYRNRETFWEKRQRE